MRPNVIKAMVVLSEFLTYNVTPEEFGGIMKRASTLEESTKDREIMLSLSHELEKALKA